MLTLGRLGVDRAKAKYKKAPGGGKPTRGGDMDDEAKDN